MLNVVKVCLSRWHIFAFLSHCGLDFVFNRLTPAALSTKDHSDLLQISRTDFKTVQNRPERHNEATTTAISSLCRLPWSLHAESHPKDSVDQ